MVLVFVKDYQTKILVKIMIKYVLTLKFKPSWDFHFSVSDKTNLPPYFIFPFTQEFWDVLLGESS